jgi:hypothetical protein
MSRGRFKCLTAPTMSSLAPDGESVTTSAGVALAAGPLTPLAGALDTLLVAGGQGAEAAAENPALDDWERQRATRRAASPLFAPEAVSCGLSREVCDACTKACRGSAPDFKIVQLFGTRRFDRPWTAGAMRLLGRKPSSQHRGVGDVEPRDRRAYRRAVQPSLIGPPRPRYEGNESCLTIANARSPNPIVNAIATATAGSIPKEPSTTNTPAASAAAVT